MTPDPLLLDETHAWLDRARRDLRSAKVLIAGEEYAGALFHCQQAAERALKGFLTFHQKPFRKIRVLSDLRPECLAIDASLESVFAQADELTKYAWRFHYPGAPYEPDHAQAADGLERAEATVRAMEHRLPPII
jgi:HEPN domain-containing protein